MKIPTIGRVVLFHDGDMVRPAMVTAVNGDKINLNVYNDATNPHRRDFGILGDPTFMLENVEAENWSWPVIVKEAKEEPEPHTKKGKDHADKGNT